MNTTISDANILLQPLRFEIYKLLKSTTSPLYIDEIAKKLSQDRRLVSYHLATMEEHGLATSKYLEIKPEFWNGHPPISANPGTGKAGRFYALTPKADRVLADLKKEI